VRAGVYTPAVETNLLYYGDNLDVLRRHVKDESVDLVYLDPPFNSNATYNVLFAEHGEKAAAETFTAYLASLGAPSERILFNHESPRRGGTFVTRKVTRAVAAILASKATATLGWRARTTFRDLVRLMLEHDLAGAGMSWPEIAPS
jgi:hypothetical protein